MDKETLSHYGWIVICVMVMAVMLAFASPFGNFIAGAIKSTTQGLFDTNQNALDSAGIEIMQQEFEEMLNGPSATDSPVKFGQPYQITMDGMLMEYVFYADGSATMWMADAMGGYMPAGTVTYTETEVILEGEPINISEDGTYLYDPEDETFKMTVKSVSNSSPKTNTPYIADPNGLIGITGLDVQIGTDGSITVYQNGVAGETIPASAITWYENHFVFNDGEEEITGAIYPDGSKVTIGEIVCVNIGDCAGVQFNKPYEYTHETGEIYTLTFYENGSFKIEVDGTVIIAEDAGAATYSPTYIDSSTYKFSVSIDGTKVTLLNTRWVFELGCSHKYQSNGYVCTICGKENSANYAFVSSDYDAMMGTTTKTDSSVVIPESFVYQNKLYKVTALADYAFQNCKNLTNVTIPNTVTSIGLMAFQNCRNLSSIDLPNSVTTIKCWAFNCEAMTSITIPESVTNISGGAFMYCENLESITVATNNQNYCSIDGVLYFKDMSAIVCYPAAKSTNASYAIPEDVTEIVYSAFYGNKYLTTITIPNSVETIGDYAFSNCSLLVSITIPDSVTSIGDSVISYCNKLEKIEVSPNNPKYCSVDGVLYSKDMSTIIYYPIGKSGTTYTIPDTVTTIDENAFVNCGKLTTIEIPNSVTYIDFHSFTSCTRLTSIIIGSGVTKIDTGAFLYCNQLATVNYRGTAEQWATISIGADNSCLTNATINYNYTGE